MLNKNWIETYPHKIYASVLLLDNKIIDYLIGEHYWKSPYNVTLRGQIPYNDLCKCKTEYTFWNVDNREEHNKVFSKLAKDWIKHQNKKITLNQLWYLIKNQAYYIYKNDYQDKNCILSWVESDDLKEYENYLVKEIYPDCDEQLFILIEKE